MHSLLEQPETQSPPRIERRRRIDIRPHRDLLSRRVTNELVRRVLRRGFLGLADTLAVVACLKLGYAFAGMLALAPAGVWTSHLPETLAVVLLGQAGAGTYGPVRQERMFERLLVGLLFSVAALALIGFGDGWLQLGVWPSLFLFVFLAGILLADRLLLAAIVARLYRRGVGVKNTLIIGPNHETWDLRERFRLAHEDIRVVGHLSAGAQADPAALGDLGELHQILEDYDVRNVVVSARIPPQEFRRLIEECLGHGAAVSVVPATLSGLMARVSGRNLLGWPLLDFEVPRLHLVQLLLKRAVDVVGSLVGILLLSPVYLAVAFAVRLESPGPVLFRQKRLGVGGRKFTIYKFRTMHMDAERTLEIDPILYARYVANNYKLPPGEDPRISRLGQFLRRTSLDELPQLFNVLKGDMSLVGPRPIVPDEICEYGERARTFLGVKPGVTGYWQINGRSRVGYPERADLDLYYISRWSLGLDLKILLLTVPRLLKGAH